MLGVQALLQGKKVIHIIHWLLQVRRQIMIFLNLGICGFKHLINEKTVLDSPIYIVMSYWGKRNST